MNNLLKETKTNKKSILKSNIMLWQMKGKTLFSNKRIHLKELKLFTSKKIKSLSNLRTLPMRTVKETSIILNPRTILFLTMKIL